MTNNPESDPNILKTQMTHLEQTNSMLQQLLTELSFEYRTPTITILGYSKVLLETDLGGTLNNEHRKYVETIQRCAIRLRDLEEETRNVVSIISLVKDSPSPTNLQLLFDKQNDVEINSITFGNDIPDIWISESWLIRVIKTLIFFPSITFPEKSISAYLSNDNQHVILQITLETPEELSIWAHDTRLLSIQNSVKPQGGSFEWNQLSKHIIEFKLELPIYNPTQLSQK